MKHIFPLLAIAALSLDVAAQVAQADIDAYLRYQNEVRKQSTLSNPKEMDSLRELLLVSAEAKRKAPFKTPLTKQEQRSVELNADVGRLRTIFDIAETRAVEAARADMPALKARAREVWLVESRAKPAKASTVKVDLLHIAAPRPVNWSNVNTRASAAELAIKSGMAFEAAVAQFGDADKKENFTYTLSESQVEAHIWRHMVNAKPDEVVGPLLIADAVVFFKAKPLELEKPETYEQAEPKIISKLIQEVAEGARFDALHELRTRAAERLAKAAKVKK